MSMRPEHCTIDVEATGVGSRPDPDALMATLATRQHGLVARRQLLVRGVPAHVVDYRVRKGRLWAVHRGVYRLGPVPTEYEREMAAVLACGERSLISHRSAAGLWGILPRLPESEPVEVSVQAGRRSRGSGVRVFRVQSLPNAERTVLRGMGVTTPQRTILDLAATVSPRELEQAVARADRRGLARPAQLQAMLARYPGRTGVGALRAIVGAGQPAAFTRSEAEERFLSLVRRAGLPAPEVNVRLRGCEVDFLWRRVRLVVEVDGYAYHRGARAFERDRRRDVSLTAVGFRVLRFTWRSLTTDPERVVARVAQALVPGVAQPLVPRVDPGQGSAGT